LIVDNFKQCLNVTVGILNIEDLDEIQEYYENLGANVTFYNVVNKPKALSIRNLPEHLKEKYRKKYPQHGQVIAELNKPKFSEDWYELFTDYMDKLYAHRKLDWRKIFEKSENNGVHPFKTVV